MSWKDAIARAGDHVERITQREKDLALLGRILDNDPELSAGEAIAFGEMSARLQASATMTLTPKQRDWANQVDDRVSEGEYDEDGAATGVPSGACLARPGRVHHFEQMAKPLKPPGRR